ncbi:hypothetical protein GTZ99_05755 [Novosphingobium sp. FSY-8]|uniref:Uncharacterized protein n=1 Tax=Novosphingobium ovatum TaxID=1908523 RepID=A0ABW9XC43_9SPHN|nr:hypothetical protein [Novosphingobium ovatum]NBC36060.1 hypothetical protein [Novosphingobium ovatum]
MRHAPALAVCALALLCAPTLARAQDADAPEALQAPPPALTIPIGPDWGGLQAMALAATPDDLEQSLSAVMADAILGRRLRAAALPTAPHRAAPTPHDDGFDWRRLTSGQFGLGDGTDLRLSQQLGAKSYDTSLKVQHASGPLDVVVTMQGSKSLTADAPMALRYDSAAWMRVLPALQVGVRARGDLGSTSGLTVRPDQTASAMARLQLRQGRSEISAETNYSVPVGETSASAVNRLRASITLKRRL